MKKAPERASALVVALPDSDALKSMCGAPPPSAFAEMMRKVSPPEPMVETPDNDPTELMAGTPVVGAEVLTFPIEAIQPPAAAVPPATVVTIEVLEAAGVAAG